MKVIESQTEIRENEPNSSTNTGEGLPVNDDAVLSSGEKEDPYHDGLDSHTTKTAT